MITKLKSIVAYIGIGMALLGMIIVYGTLRANGFNWNILLTGISLIAIPVVVYLISERLPNDEKPNVRSLKDLKTMGIGIPVDLTKCKVKSNSWSVETEKYDDPRIVFLNEISGHSDKNIEKVESNLSQIEYNCDFNGKRRIFLSRPIAKDNVTLRILLEIQKETVIYVDRDDDKYYYFDLEFVE